MAKGVAHQLPMGAFKERATALMSRDMLVHPGDLVKEIDMRKQEFGGDLPGNLIIDERAILGLDTHRAMEAALNSVSEGGRGSTGMGIATGYASVIERNSVTMKDLMDDDWEKKFREHYRLYEMKLKGFPGFEELNNVQVSTLDTEKGKKRNVGTEAEFIDRLREARYALKPYVSSRVFFLLQETWENPHIPVTIEFAQGPGLDPKHGVYPDVTASRPLSRFINDATYNVVLAEQIAIRAGVTKTIYVSSVGRRRLPTIKDETQEKWIQEEFDERGRTTGRLRDIYPISIPIAQYLRDAAGYEYLVATHLDASRVGKPIKVITHYTDKVTGEEMPYFPYQDYLDKLEPHPVEFPGWDGEAVKQSKSPDDLPYEVRLYLSFLSRTIAPVAIGTTGPDIGDYISWIPNFGKKQS